MMTRLMRKASVSVMVGEQPTVIHDTIGLMASQCIVPPHTHACISTHTHTLTYSVVFVIYLRFDQG